jgi:hypothetical protein
MISTITLKFFAPLTVILLFTVGLKSQNIHTSASDTTLPENFPVISVRTMTNPSPGYLFIAPFGSWGMFPDIDSHIAIIDNYGHPVYFKKISHNNINDFKLQPGGQLTYSGGSGIKHYIMNEKMQVTDSLRPTGYWTDHHEIIITPENHKFLIGIDTRITDMSQLVPGGQEEAMVMGHAIQELDSANEIVFEWNTWDHYDILDCEPYVDLTASVIDFAHINTIEIDSDTSLLVLARNMNEITRIDRRSGEMIWRMGGIHNEFTFVNDTLQWGWPHDIRKIGEGLFTIFDNGRFNTPEPHFSSGVIYEIDEASRTITQIQRFRNEPDVFGNIMGNFQRLENGNYLTGWGSGSYPDSIAITEFNTDGTLAHVVAFNAINYRAWKHQWQPKLFYPENDTLNFGNASINLQNEIELKIFNSADSAIDLTGHHFRFGHFHLDTLFPITIPANDTGSLNVYFQPAETGLYEDVLTLHSDNADKTQRIGRQILISATAIDDTGIDTPENITIITTPNPAHNTTTVNLPEVLSGTCHLSDLKGNLVKEFVFNNQQAVTIDLGNLDQGIFLIEIIINYNQKYTAKLIKN